jgi:Apea-like HEPN
MDRMILNELVASALTAMRNKVVQRLNFKSLPLSLPVTRLSIASDEDEDGPFENHIWEDVTVNSLHDSTIAFTIRDILPSIMLSAPVPELDSLASYLGRESNLGTRPQNFLGSGSDTFTMLVNYLGPFVAQYLRSLPSLEVDDHREIERLTEELYQCAESSEISRTHQFAVSGVAPNAQYSHRNVTIRPLSPLERGAFYLHKSATVNYEPVPGSNFMLPGAYSSSFVPTTLVEVTHSRLVDQKPGKASLPDRVALAFYLLDYDLSGTGIITAFDHPTWAANYSQSAFPTAEEPLARDRQISTKDFSQVVDLAYKMPPFGDDSDKTRAIALSRALRGFGVRRKESAFLDFAIALEAVLLSGATTELAYRFRLYGALFLADTLDSKETFKRLQNIYEVRSRLVHGGSITREQLATAQTDIVPLARAVIRKAVEHGWPNSLSLDVQALGARRQISASVEDSESSP